MTSNPKKVFFLGFFVCIFIKLLDKKILEKKELATKALEGGSFAALIVNFKTIIASIIVITGVITIILQLDSYIIFAALFVIAANGVFSFLEKKHQYNVDEEMTPVNRKISYYIDLSTDHSIAKEIRLFRMKDKLIDRYKSLYNETLKILDKLFRVRRNINCGSSILNYALEICIFLYLGYCILVKSVITISDFTLYGNAVRQFKDSMNGLMSSFVDIDNHGRYLKDYFEFIRIESVFHSGSRTIPDTGKLTIRFENVSYIYPNSTEYALKNINLTITDKSCLSLVGENGSGKTTFVKLLTRLCDPTEGTIYLNDMDIRTLDYDQYQKLFSAVFQDFNLYAFTIRENVTMLDESDNGDEQINDILQYVGLDSRIDKASAGLNTYLYYIYDENGIELSGGEGQKLATARAIYKNSDVLVLDEPTAALDPRSEFEIFSKFRDITKDHMSIYISHRLSSCRFSDAVAVFKNGEIIEYGNHKDLLLKKGAYFELYSMQSQFYNENED